MATTFSQFWHCLEENVGHLKERKKERIFISPPTRINSAIGLMALIKNGKTGITKTRKLNKQIKQMDVPWRLSTR
jgi:hypothetical protein